MQLLELSLGMTEKSPESKACETLGLLAAVAYVDDNLWKKLLLHCTGLEIDAPISICNN